MSRIILALIFSAFFSIGLQAQTIIHYWHFNALTGTVDSVPADYTVLNNAPFITYPGSGDGYMDDVNEGSSLNLRLGQAEGRGLRVRNPSDTRTLMIPLPTTDYDSVHFSYAVTRTNNGAHSQWLSFSTDAGQTWSNAAPFQDTVEITDEYELHRFDFSAHDSVNDNADFLVRIQFLDGSENLSGNNRFDNIVLEGNHISGNPPVLPDLVHYWHFNDLSGTDLNDVQADYTLHPHLSPVVHYAGSGDGFMDEFSPGSALNAQMGEGPGLALRVRNPSFDRSLVIDLPTTDCEDVIFLYAAHRSGSGMLFNNIAYTLDGINYDTTGFSPSQVIINEEYELYTFDFSGIAGANNNASFKVRITWMGNTNQSNGNNRYDNMALFATYSLSAEDHAQMNNIRIYPNPASDVLNFELTTQNGAPYVYQLIDMNGQLLERGENQSGQQKHLSTRGYPSGSYILQFAQNGKTVSKRVLIQH